MKFQYGEWMGLMTDGDFNFIKGHLSLDEAKLVAAEALREYENQAELTISVHRVDFQNARFGIGYDECGEKMSWLYTHRPEGERGSFPVTVVEYSINE